MSSVAAIPAKAASANKKAALRKARTMPHSLIRSF